MTPEEFVKTRHRTAACSPRKAGGRLKYEIVYKPAFGGPKRISGLCTTEAAAWESAAKRLHTYKKN